MTFGGRMILNHSYSSQNLHLIYNGVLLLLLLLLGLSSLPTTTSVKSTRTRTRTTPFAFAFVSTTSSSNIPLARKKKFISIVTTKPAAATTTTTTTTTTSPSLLSMTTMTNTNSNNDNNNDPPPQYPPQQQVMKAWTCHGHTQQELVENLQQAQIIKSDKVRQVMGEVDRSNYYYGEPSQAFLDAPQPIGHGQTISAPHMHAHVLEEFAQHYLSIMLEDPHTTPLNMLDVGCGSGYLTAAFGRWVHPRCRQEDDSTATTTTPNILNHASAGKVWGIDVHPALVDNAHRNIQRQDSDLLELDIVNLQIGNGWKGIPREAPFDFIHVGAAATQIPIPLMMQLRIGTGMMILPVGPTGEIQTLIKVERLQAPSLSSSPNNHSVEIKEEEWYTNVELYHPDDFRITKLMNVRYVPLVHP